MEIVIWYAERFHRETNRTIGVLARDFRPEPPAEVWLPFQADPKSTGQAHYVRVAARLRDGFTIDRANAALKLTTAEFRRRSPPFNPKYRNRPVDDDGQIQFNGSADFALLVGRDIGSDVLSGTFYRCDSHCQASQPAASSARGRDRREPADPPAPACGARLESSRDFRGPAADRWELAVVAARAEIPRCVSSTSPKAMRMRRERSSRWRA